MCADDTDRTGAQDTALNAQAKTDGRNKYSEKGSKPVKGDHTLDDSIRGFFPDISSQTKDFSDATQVSDSYYNQYNSGVKVTKDNHFKDNTLLPSVNMSRIDDTLDTERIICTGILGVLQDFLQGSLLSSKIQNHLSDQWRR